jgi:hypothetical protein
MEKFTEVIPFKVDLLCDECGTEMKWNGVILTSYPPKYPHMCPKCGAVQKTLKSYPDIIYQPKIKDYT